jgi:Protein of unknown function (DUF1573).
MKSITNNLPLLFAASLLFLVMSACTGQKKVTQEEINLDPYITFEQQRVDFGNVKAGERPEFIYKFKNTGSEPIIIELISGCDCTQFIDTPEGKTFLPGEMGSFKIIFKSDTEEERGKLEKTIDILLENTDPKTGYQIIKEVFYELILSD